MLYSLGKKMYFLGIACYLILKNHIKRSAYIIKSGSFQFRIFIINCRRDIPIIFTETLKLKFHNSIQVRLDELEKNIEIERKLNYMKHGILNGEIKLDDNTDILLRCPLCSELNSFDLKRDTIYAINQKCSICCDNSVQIRLYECHHAVFCTDCAFDLIKNI